MNYWKASTFAMLGILMVILLAGFRQRASGTGNDRSLWPVYEQYLKNAKYVDLTHRITPSIPVWHGFGPAKFMPTVDPATNRPYTYAKDGFEATHYDLSTDQLGTQLDPPAHWNPYFPAIDELPPTYAVRSLVVIPIQDKVAIDPGYQMTVDDIRAWEQRHGRIPEGSVVFIRSDWSKRWPDPKLAEEKKFPGVTLAALKFLHLQRHILFHGHEPLDTDDTPTLEGEAWLLRNGYTQAEGVTHLDEVPENAIDRGPRAAEPSLRRPLLAGDVVDQSRGETDFPRVVKLALRFVVNRVAPGDNVPFQRKTRGLRDFGHRHAV